MASLISSENPHVIFSMPGSVFTPYGKGGYKETEVLKWNSKFLLKSQTLALDRVNDRGRSHKSKLGHSQDQY